VEKSQERLPQRALIVVTLLSLAATLIVWWLMRTPEAQMQAAGGYGIVDYELAYSPQTASTILSAWGEAGQQAARRSLLIDFGFMPSYGLLFAGLTLLIARGQAGALNRVGRWLAFAPLVAALCDALENVMLLTMLGSGASAGPPLVAGVAATIKFGLLLIVIGYWIVSGVARLFRRT